MSIDLSVRIGAVTLKNPIIAGPAEHLIEASGILRALDAGVGAVVVKSNNESEGAKDQLERSEYTLLDAYWRPVAWNDQAPRHATLACRSGMSPMRFDAWLEQAARLDAFVLGTVRRNDPNKSKRLSDQRGPDASAQWVQ